MSIHQGEFPRPSAPTSRPVELFATVALAVSTLVAVTVVSIGIARADVIAAHADADAAPFAIAVFMGLLFVAMGGLTAAMAESRSTPRD